MGLKEVFQKQGGAKLLKQYWKGGAFFTAAGEFLLLGKSRTALEILRLSADLKIKQKLEKQYKDKLLAFDKAYDTNIMQHHSRRIWVCWLQGMENGPDIVKVCFNSLQVHLSNREIILITEKNYRDYVAFPEIIQRKIDLGIIKGAHMTDLLRLELLIKYGGTWIDATVLCTDSSIPSYMLDSDLFMFQCLKPGRDGHTTVCSNWFITATSNNRLLFLMQQLLYSYWMEHDELLHYFIFHIFFQLCLELHPEEWNKVVPFSNATPHILLLRLFEPYDELVWNAIRLQTPFHKLTYKFNEEQIHTKGTYYDELFEKKHGAFVK